MKYLGIDYGSKRIGIAISDDTATYAFPHSIIKNSPRHIDEIVALCLKEGVGAIILGESNNYSGKANDIMSDTKEFMGEMTLAINLPIYFEPEFMTSIQATRDQGENKLIDASAAALILQSYLDKKKNGVK